MEVMPYQHGVDVVASTTWTAGTTSGWRAQLPVLQGAGLTLRELRQTDAPSLHAHLTTAQVARFISPPPTSVSGFEDFVTWSHVRRAEGKYVCFGIVPEGSDEAVGIFQIQLAYNQPPEWGFVLGAQFWGTGLFVEGAAALMDFAFDDMGLERLAARAAVDNGRGNGALRKIGAIRNARIPRGVVRGVRLPDQYYWTSTPQNRPRRKVKWDLAAC
jgi:[ribosomal protein S5]-alanine N-acetyltransferase